MAHLSLSLLGACEARRDGVLLTGFRTVRVRVLLAYLAVQAERAHGREALANLLWPEQPDATARTYLRQALANLRTVLDEPAAGVPTLLFTRDTVQLNPACSYDLDVTAFHALLAACARHPHRRAGTCTACAQRLEQAVALYRGSFLGQFYLRDSAPFEEWAALTREALHQEAVTALAQLATYYERRRTYDAVARLAWQQIGLDPWREEAHQQLMRALALNGQRSAALKQYERCRRVLASELGVEPAAETTALYEHIRDSASAELSAQKDEPLRLQNFPAETTALIGRENDLAELGALLENPACRLITIVGPGGIGKTRLALAAAREQAAAFTHGAAFVPLVAISSAAFVAPAILAALGVVLQGVREPRDQLLEYLRGKELLLVLDNFEQLLAPDLSEHEGGDELLTAILQCASDVTLLVTSRERLALDSEWLYDLAGLSYPPGEPSGGVKTYGAIQLFVQRASQVRRHVDLTDREAHTVARICQLVEGLPLAIELAAAALRGRSITAIAEAIESSVMALASGLRAIPEQHRSMWATFEHSWRLLSDEERQVVPRLSVFRGGFEEDAAGQIAQASPDLLASLMDKSLLRWNGVARYDLHELVRQYAGAKLEAAGEAEPLQRQHAEYYLALAESAAPHLFGANQVALLDRLTMEHDNFRAVLAWCQTGSGRFALGLRIGGALENYWRFRAHHREGHNWIVGFLAQEADEAAAEPRPMASRAALQVRAKALRTAGDQKKEVMGDLAQARTFLAESVRLYRDLEEPVSLAHSLWSFAHLEWTQGAYVHAAELAEESLRLDQAADYGTGISWALWLLSNIVREEGDLERAAMLADMARQHAEELTLPVNLAYAYLSISRVRLAMGELVSAHRSAEEALTIGRRAAHPPLIAHVLLQQGRIAQAEGDGRLASELWELALSGARPINLLRALAEILLELGWAEHEQGNDERAQALLTESLRLYQARGHQIFIAECLAGLAGVAVAMRPTPAVAYCAVRLYGATDLLIAAGNAMLRPDARAAHVRDLAAARAQLDEGTWEAAWAEGRAMPLEQAIAYALHGADA